LDDARLMHAVANADATAIRTLLERLKVRFRRIAGALLRNDADADDAAQVALLEVLRAASSFRGESAVERWADRIAVRVSMRIARERRLRRVRTESEVVLDELAAPETEDSLRASLPRELVTYLAELPEARRTALVLRHVLGYSVEEIAELTQTSPNTVKDRLLSARDQMRRLVRRDTCVRKEGA
jgi:RNA polymerase sigma-70 factor (ECF subfamily)